MFDVGFTELALLLVIGLLVLGPERLPRVARTLGLYVRKARAAWFNLSHSIEQELNAEELKRSVKTIGKEAKEATAHVADGLKKAMASADSDLDPDLDFGHSILKPTPQDPEATEEDADALEVEPDTESDKEGNEEGSKKNESP